jgi:hypothetical protein
MDVMKMLAELRQEREQIEEAILTLERLAQGRGRRRGRPPLWLAGLKAGDEKVVSAVGRPKVRAAVSAKAAV